jgi:glucose/arabinose dehydrogenase
MVISGQSAAHARPLALTRLTNRLERPVHLTQAPREAGCLIISEHAGLVKKFCKDSNSLKKLVDLRDVIDPKSSRGLLGTTVERAKDNEHARLFLSYIDTQGDLLVVRFPVAEGRLLDENDMSVVIKIARIAPNGHGSALDFLPDGTLLVTSGDGESEVKNSSHAAQSKTSPLGKVLRLNVTGSTGYKPAGDPSLLGFLPEVWAIGFRNPDQLTIDHQNGDVLVADNGESVLELNLVQGGRNYGWDIVEDRTCQATACKASDYTAPVLALPRKDVQSKLIVGATYRGSLLPELRGSFIYAEAHSGTLYSARHNQASPWPHTLIAKIPGKTISALSNGTDGEIYLTSSDGNLFQLSEAPPPAN